MPEGQPSAAEDRASLLGLGKAWTNVGYGTLILSALAFVAFLTIHPFLPAMPGMAVPEGYRLVGQTPGAPYLKASADGIATVFLLIFSALATFVWTFVDLIDRRKRFIWLLPMFVCPLIAGLHALPLALYLFFARNIATEKSGVQ